MSIEDKIRVLIVDDEPTWLHSLHALAESLGFEVTGMADNLADAITLVNEGNFDVAILDIVMQKKKVEFSWAR